MNYAQARQRQADGRWDWTTHNDRTGTRPSGYCAGWQYDKWLAEPSPVVPRHLTEQEAERRRPFQAKYHTDGHTTKEEAERCHYEYQLDELRELSAGRETRHQCQAKPDGQRCEQWTDKALEIGQWGGRITWLCDAHRARDVFAGLHPFSPGGWEAHS